jgi:hypothetical protein
MHRREALKNVALLMGTAISATTMSVLFEGFTLPEHEKNTVNFTADQEKILAEFADVIIPTTKAAPGAKAANVGPFIAMMIKDCYTAKQQLAFAEGLKQMEAKAVNDYSKDFLAITVQQRNKLIADLREEAIAQKNSKPASYQFFTWARDLTILGYFSSEIGCTQARAYLPIPGKYDGNAPLKPGQKSWAT